MFIDFRETEKHPLVGSNPHLGKCPDQESNLRHTQPFGERKDGASN